MTTYDSINAERRKRKLREFTLSEYEQHRGRYARMAAPGTDLQTWLLSLALSHNTIPDYNAQPAFLPENWP